MKKQIVFFFFFLLIIVSAKAQFNDSIHNYIQYAATGVINKTENTRSFLISNAVTYNLRKKKNAFNFDGSYVYGKQLGVKSNDDLNSSVDFNLYPKDSSKLYYWGLVNYDKSFSLNILGRVQAGIGVGYIFFKSERRSLSISEGILYENSKVRLDDGTIDKNNLARNSFRLNYRFVIKDIIVIKGTNLLQNAFGNSDDYIIKLDNSLNLTLNTWLSFRAGFTYNRNNLTGRDNMLITLGLTAEKFF